MLKFKTIVFAIDPGNVQSGMNPGGQLKADVCANLIINLISSNVLLLNGKFVNLQTTYINLRTSEKSASLMDWISPPKDKNPLKPLPTKQLKSSDLTTGKFA